MKEHYRIFIFLIFLIVLFSSPFLYFLRFPDFLLKNKSVESNVLLAEGWLRDPELWAVNREFETGKYDYVITTGQEYPRYYKMNMNGYLIFYTGKDLMSNNGEEHHEIIVDAKSSLAENIPAHFNFFINEKVIADFYVNNEWNTYKIQWEGDLSDMDSILIHFDNDAYRHGEDRNLFIRGITVDSIEYLVHDSRVEYDIHRLDGKQRIRNFDWSYAESARETLIKLGMDSAKIISVPGNNANFLRTYYSAISFREWMDRSQADIRGITIISRGIHSRRTWITYRAILDMPGRTGIIALPDPVKPGLHTARRYLVYETAGYFYYRFILLPWYKIKAGWNDIMNN